MRNNYLEQLSELHAQIIQMGELCEAAVLKATDALQEGNLEKAQAVIDGDQVIDQKEKDIERLCLKLLLQQQPVAKDLRQVSAALKMITDMERVGDQAADIAEIIISAKLTGTKDMDHIMNMAIAAGKMVRDSITAYVEQDLELSRNVILSDDIIDQMFNDIRKELIQIVTKLGAEQGEKAIDLIMIVKYLERIGDHATNIAEWVEFSITGIHNSQ